MEESGIAEKGDGKAAAAAISSKHRSSRMKSAVSLRLPPNTVSRCLDSVPSLQQLHSAAKCPICYDYYHNAVSLPCLHTFCSVCIRRTLYFKSGCPVCSVDCVASDLKPNFQLGTISEQLQLLEQQITQQIQGEMERVWEEQAKNWQEKQGITEAVQEEDEIQIVAPENSELKDSAAAVAAVPSAPTPAKVECPVCGVSVIMHLINRHLDECVGKEENRNKKPSAVDPKSSRQPLPFPAYNLLTDKQLKKLLSDLSFPTSGASAAGLPLDRESSDSAASRIHVSTQCGSG
jgi:E3 ubiquitin-protein ligase RAD18